ncbi:MAG: hypothetical protein H0X17_03070 [Deltaproteobacteria bacterium]|nr:hypothetical protein [Deltaproteobacteria bacterium]
MYDVAVNAAEDRAAFALKWGAVVLRWPERQKLLDVRYPQVHAVQISDDNSFLGIAGHDGRVAVLRMP